MNGTAVDAGPIPVGKLGLLEIPIGMSLKDYKKVNVTKKKKRQESGFMRLKRLMGEK